LCADDLGFGWFGAGANVASSAVQFIFMAGVDIAESGS
jgi:hypothetical protein